MTVTQLIWELCRVDIAHLVTALAIACGIALQRNQKSPIYFFKVYQPLAILVGAGT